MRHLCDPRQPTPQQPTQVRRADRSSPLGRPLAIPLGPLGTPPQCPMPTGLGRAPEPRPICWASFHPLASSRVRAVQPHNTGGTDSVVSAGLIAILITLRHGLRKRLHTLGQLHRLQHLRVRAIAKDPPNYLV